MRTTPARRLASRRPRIRRALDGAMGTALVALGVRLATTQSPAAR